MYAAVTTVFDVSSLLQSWKWSVEAYTAAGCRYSMVMVSVYYQPAALPQSSISLLRLTQ
jgi:hypothetical protein